MRKSYVMMIDFNTCMPKQLFCHDAKDPSTPVFLSYTIRINQYLVMWGKTYENRQQVEGLWVYDLQNNQIKPLKNAALEGLRGRPLWPGIGNTVYIYGNGGFWGLNVKTDDLRCINKDKSLTFYAKTTDKVFLDFQKKYTYQEYLQNDENRYYTIINGVYYYNPEGKGINKIVSR